MRAHQAEFRIATMARVLGVSPSGYYAWRNRERSTREQSDEALSARVRKIHQRSRGTYGAPRIHAELAAQGTQVSRKRVARVMREAGLSGVSRRKGPRTTRRDTEGAPGAGPRRASLRRRRTGPAVGRRHRAPRGALEPCGGERPPPPARRSGPVEAEGSLTRGTPVKAEAALTTTGRARTVRWRGSGKRDGKVYARNQRRKASQEKTTSSNLTDGGWVATRTRPAWPGGELFGRLMSPARRPQ